jgi:hypothetical protein
VVFIRGIQSLLGHESHSLENVLLNYVILAISFVFEANALRIAISLFKKTIEEEATSLVSLPWLRSLEKARILL